MRYHCTSSLVELFVGNHRPLFPHFQEHRIDHGIPAEGCVAEALLQSEYFELSLSRRVMACLAHMHPCHW